MKKFDFGANLRKIRKEKTISQEAIANYLGVSQKTYSRMEYNKTTCTSDQISKIAAFYGVGLKDLATNARSTPDEELPKKEKRFLGLQKRHFIEAAVYLALVPSSW